MILDLSTKEVNVILAALGMEPHNQVRALIDKIYQQGQPQAQAKLDEAMPVIDLADLQANGQPPEPQPEATPSPG